MSNPSCFVIAPFGEPFDAYYQEILRPAIRRAGLDPLRADEINKPGVIVNQIWHGIIDSDVCLADVTGRNANVMYELGIAHAIGKPVVPIVQDTSDLPFDLQSFRFIVYETSTPSWAAVLERRVADMLREAIDDPIRSVALGRATEFHRPRQTWLTVRGVDLGVGGRWNSPSGVKGVRVIVEVNSHGFSYPTRAVWAEPSPEMSHESFAVELSDEYRVRLEMMTIDVRGSVERFISQNVDRVIQANLPSSNAYRLYQVGTEGFRSGKVVASVEYEIV